MAGFSTTPPHWAAGLGSRGGQDCQGIRNECVFRFVYLPSWPARSVLYYCKTRPEFCRIRTAAAACLPRGRKLPRTAEFSAKPKYIPSTLCYVFLSVCHIKQISAKAAAALDEENTYKLYSTPGGVCDGNPDLSSSLGLIMITKGIADSCENL